MCIANATWGAPRIHGELLKLGIEVSQATVAKYMTRRGKPPFQTWHTFLENVLKTMVSIDFLVVPTISFRILFVFLVMSHDRRRVLHFNVTAHPTAEWTAESAGGSSGYCAAVGGNTGHSDSLQENLFHRGSTAGSLLAMGQLCNLPELRHLELKPMSCFKTIHKEMRFSLRKSNETPFLSGQR
jgi:hypothetical protein